MKTFSSCLHACALAAAIAVAPAAAFAQGKPQYGGELRLGTVYVGISALSWDPADYNWKINHDAGGQYEVLWAGDLSKSVKNGGKHRFVADAWLPSDAIRGELAETWKWIDPLKLEVKLRKGIMYPEKPGVMKAREFVADDVVYAFTRQEKSPKKVPEYLDHMAKVEATDKHTVLFTFKNYNAEWDYRWGWGYYSAIVPKEVVDAGASNWKNVNGTGPYLLQDFQAGNSNTYVKNPNYWDKEKIGGQEYKLPFVDKITYRTIKDEATRYSLLRTGKLDILEVIRASEVEDLKKQAPQLKWSRTLAMAGTYMAMRVDVKPFDDIRVRRAMNMAVDRQAIIKSIYSGHAEVFGFPMHPDYVGYFEPLTAMPQAVQELYTYNPAKAKQLLAEAGYPNGFSFKVQYNAVNGTHADLVQMLASYYDKIGVKLEIQPMEYPAFLSAMTTRTNAPLYLMDNGHTNPTTSIRKNFVKGQVWNPSQWNDPAFEKKMDDVLLERDEGKRQIMLKVMTREILEKAPYVWLPTPYNHVAWWPWVKNYDGELRAGAVRPWPIYSRIWIDQDLKKKLGK
ncbi:ABC transporter substrate-binding protein [Piscinibacter sp. HJYY11]|uniref:ABC transporter substrate-binding protein n=1 Tax=Piscinibacter sp. HJYY11 TaxID=2801333 RepID=UPI00191FED0A|nr:ABC transporter substrate-binding protein [Piscinibacter sp. HJYY11]MBL0729966.1 ABC transporter substrate-binding protein [Piscinibacter sp. HJYY11]